VSQDGAEMRAALSRPNADGTPNLAHAPSWFRNSNSFQTTIICSTCSHKIHQTNHPTGSSVLCEFLSDYHFNEIKYVPGPNDVVPDSPSRPWQAQRASEYIPPAIHLLAFLSTRCRRTRGAPLPHPSVMVLPTCKDALQFTGGKGNMVAWDYGQLPCDTGYQRFFQEGFGTGCPGPRTVLWWLSTAHLRGTHAHTNSVALACRLQ